MHMNTYSDSEDIECAGKQGSSNSDLIDMQGTCDVLKDSKSTLPGYNVTTHTEEAFFRTLAEVAR